MNETPILPDDEPVSLPSMPTMRGGDPNTLGRIDHYDLLRKLGGGGFGVVYLARDTASGVEVAIKTLHPLLKHNAEEMDLLREKFALVSRLAHPNIATALVLHPVRDINVFDETARRELKLSPGDSVMVMRYAPGVTLSKWRRQFPDGVVPPDLALEIGRQIAAALDYAHGERIVHRDIKPSNVMVETVAAEPRPLDHGQGAARSPGAPTLRVRILDFGLAAEIRSSMSRVSTEAGDTSGTRPYMAPEQWLGKKQDGRTDQYALACVLYELLSGAPPFVGVFETGDPAIMERAVLGRAPDEIEDAAPATNAALLRALAKAPKERFPSCAAFVAALGGGAEIISHAGNAEGAEPGGASRPGEPQSQAALEAKRLQAAREDEYRRNEELGQSEISRKEKRIKWGVGAAVLAVVAGVFIWGASQDSTTPSRPVATPSAWRPAPPSQPVVPPTTQPAPPSQPVAPPTTQPNAAAWKAHSLSAPHAAGGVALIDLGGGVKLEMVHCSDVAPDFWMGKYEVTQEQWQRVTGMTPSHFKNKPKNPVETVSWNECQEFVRKLNALPEAKASGLTFRLPTEEEWETACRAGAPKGSDYCKLADGTQITSANLSRVAWFDKGWDDGSTEVGKNREPNDWGLYDMHGNVWEWTETAVAVDGYYRVNRGGSFRSTADYCTAGFRHWDSPAIRYWYLGLRLAADGRTAAGGVSRPGEPPSSSVAIGSAERLVSPENAHAAGDRFVATVAGISVPMHWCPATTSEEWKRISGGRDFFTMGSPSSEDGHASDETQHRVTLTQGFGLGETEVTQGLWKNVMGDNPSILRSGDDYPVENVSWNDCQDFLKKLNAQAPVAGFKWALPTEAQWEYACRAGTTTAYFWGNDLNGDRANCNGNAPCGMTAKGPYKQKTTRVGSYAANPWGFFDMHGNVWEWCADLYGSYPSGVVTDPKGPSLGSDRVNRGGSWYSSARYCRSAYRFRNGPDYRLNNLGFRVALVPVQ